MEKRPPLGARPALGLGSSSSDEGAQPPSARDQTPLPAADSGDWSDLGATRVVDAAAAANTEVKPDDTALPPPTPLTIAENVKFGDYRLLKKVGEGAMGEVWKAHQISFKRNVALKILFPHVAANEKLVNRLNREARIMWQLDHANIVQAYAVDEIEGRHYVAMEFIDGESLQKWLTRVGRLEVGDAVAITLACARALQYAHVHKLVHRDIKPDNVLLSRNGEIKVADFGMVKTDDEVELTQTGHAVGTPWYMPLEQARNAKETDGRCDIYALGCLLYCLLTGHPPFTGRTLVDVIEAKEKGTFPPARKTNDEVPERLDLIIFKMTAKLPAHRYQTCTDLIKDLEALQIASESLSFIGRPSTAPQAKPSQPMPGSDEARNDIWYLRFRDAEGKPQVRKLTRAQILQLASKPRFDPTAKASRDPKEGFRALGTYKEFEHAVIGRLSKTAADQNTVRYRSLYKKIEEQERQRERALEPQPVSTFYYWLPIFFRVAGVCAGVGLIGGVLWYFARELAK